MAEPALPLDNFLERTRAISRNKFVIHQIHNPLHWLLLIPLSQQNPFTMLSLEFHIGINPSFVIKVKGKPTRQSINKGHRRVLIIILLNDENCGYPITCTKL